MISHPFVFGTQSHDDDTIARCLISQPLDRHSLLAALAENLRFPGYFGMNWDAMVDCLCDIPKRPKLIAIDHLQVPSLSKSDLRRYVLALLFASNELDSFGEGEKLVVSFPESARELILDIVNKESCNERG